MSVAGTVNSGLRAVPVSCLYCVGMLPALWLFWRGATGGLGPEPIGALEHELGLLALQFVIAALAVSPLRRITGVNLMCFRRAFGVLAFLYMALHLAVWAVLDLRDPALIWEDLTKRPYILVGMAAFLLAVPLTATSNDWALRRIGGAAWRRLHRLTYPMVLLAGIHFVMVRKGLQIEPLIYLGLISGLLLWRMRPRRPRVAA